MTKVKVAKPKWKVIKPYTPEQIKAMLKVCDWDYAHNAKLLGSRNRAMVLVLYDTGLRLSELVSLNLQDIDVERGWIRAQGKGSKERMVRIGRTAQKALWRYLMHRPKNGRQEIWLSEEGKPLHDSGVQSVVDRLKKRAGISEEGCIHRFRHSFALNFLKVDRNPFNLQYLLGHSSLEMVRHYTATLGMQDALEAHVKASPADLLGLK